TQGPLALESLWAFHVSAGLPDAAALEFLDHPTASVRCWTVRFVGDRATQDLNLALESKLTELAARDPDLEVRAQLAATAKRLPARPAVKVIRQLRARDEDAGDPRLPLLIWWALEAKADPDTEKILALFEDA